MNQNQIDIFLERVKYETVDGVTHTLYPSVNANIEGVSRRPHVIYWFLDAGRWPGRLKKSCDVYNCISHYNEIRTRVGPLDDTSWGSGRAYSEKYGVSQSYISRVRRNAR